MLVELRGGDMSPLTRVLFRILLIWAIGQVASPSEGFRPVNLNPSYGPLGQPYRVPRVAPKLRENPLNQNNQGPKTCTNNQHSADGTLTKAQRRNLPHEQDVHIVEENVVIRHGQANYKMRKHGHDFEVPYSVNDSGWKRTARTPENLQKFKDELVKTTRNGERIEGTYRNDQKVIHYYDAATERNVIYKADTKEFVSAWKLLPQQVEDLLKNKNVGNY